MVRAQPVTHLMTLCFIIYCVCFYNILVWFGHADGEDLGSDGTTEPVHKRLRLSSEDGEDPQDSTSTEYSVVTLPSEYKHTVTHVCAPVIPKVTFIPNGNANIDSFPKLSPVSHWSVKQFNPKLMPVVE